MAIRVTQLFAQYAADPTTESDVRVTRVYAQVAVKAEQVFSAEDTLTYVEVAVEGIHGPATDVWAPLTENVVAGVDSNESATDTLTYTEEAILDLARASDDLTYTEDVSAEGSEYTAGASDTWMFAEGAFDIAFSEETWTLTEEAIERSCSIDTWVFTEDLQVSAEYNISVTDNWVIVETAAVSADYCTTVVDDMDEFVDEFDPDTNTIIQVQVGGYQEEAIGGKATTFAASDAWFLTEFNNGWVVPADGPGVFTETASDTLTYTETARALDEGDSDDTLTYTESATADVGPRANDTLTYTESAVAGLESTATASDTWVLSEGLTYLLESAARTECVYSPFMGTDTDPNAPSPPPTQYEPAKEASGFKLQFPDTGPVTDEVVLPNPSFGNRDRLEFARVQQETLGGTLIIFADPIWPKTHTRQFTFENMTEAQARSLLTFMEAHAGVSIRLIDQEGRDWVGLISEMNDPIVQDGRGCQWTASLEFQGTRVGTIGADDEIVYTEVADDPP